MAEGFTNQALSEGIFSPLMIVILAGNFLVLVDDVAQAEALSWTRADCSIYEGEDAGGQLLFRFHHHHHYQRLHHPHDHLHDSPLRIEHNDLRDRAVFDSDGQELPTGSNSLSSASASSWKSSVSYSP